MARPLSLPRLKMRAGRYLAQPLAVEAMVLVADQHRHSYRDTDDDAEPIANAGKALRRRE